MNKEGEMCAEFYNYRVEFQLRGAGHIHGTLWIDWDRLQDKLAKVKKRMIQVIMNHIIRHN